MEFSEQKVDSKIRNNKQIQNSNVTKPKPDVLLESLGNWIIEKLVFV